MHSKQFCFNVNRNKVAVIQFFLQILSFVENVRTSKNQFSDNLRGGRIFIHDNLFCISTAAIKISPRLIFEENRLKQVNDLATTAATFCEHWHWRVRRFLVSLISFRRLFSHQFLFCDLAVYAINQSMRLEQDRNDFWLPH